MKKIIDKNEHVTSNSKQVEILKKNFPNCFDKDGKFLPEKLNSIINDDVEISNESYELNWLGKKYARLLANQEVTTMLTEDVEHNSKPENINSENLYLEGDNLEVLKHMVNSYSNKIKMIYIDPPYNTGTDFIYKDDRKFTVKELSNLANVDEDEAKRILEFTESNSNSHSAWLTFMYPRLYVSRELLKDEGSLYISIDDNEKDQLKLLCDEIFGEENFVANVIWEKKYSPQNDAKWYSATHDNILIYAKEKSIYRPILLERSAKQNSRYKNPDNDPRGDWKSSDLSVKTYSEEYDYEIITPSGRSVTLPEGRCWMTSKENMDKLIADNRIWFGKNGDNVPSLKRFLVDVKQGITPMTIWKREEVGDNQEAKQELKKIMPENLFDTPKPIRLIKKIIALSLEENDIVLDFFSGSATTAVSLMEFNVERNRKNKFIMVQLNESVSEKIKTDFFKKHKYERTIPSIAKERIKRCSNNIKLINQNNENIKDIDLGFKVFKTKPFIDTNYFNNLDTFDDSQTELLVNNNMSYEELADLLLTWKLHDGIEFSKQYNELMLDNYIVHYIDDKAYFMYKDFTNRNIIQLLEELDDTNSNFAVRNLIVFAANFTSKEQRELVEAVKGYKNKKKIELNIELRY